MALFLSSICESSLENEIAERQLAMKSKSWFVGVSKTLSKYNLPSAQVIFKVLTPNTHTHFPGPISKSSVPRSRTTIIALVLLLTISD